MGGLSARDLLAALRAQGARLDLFDDKTRFKVTAPAGTIGAELREALRADRDALLELLRAESTDNEAASVTTPRPDVVAEAPEGVDPYPEEATRDMVDLSAAEASPVEAPNAVTTAEKLLGAARATGWPAFDLLGWGPIGGSEDLWRHFAGRADGDERWLARAAAALALWIEMGPETKWAERRFREAQKAIPIAWGAKPEGAVGWKNELPPPPPAPRSRWGLAMLSPDGAALLEAGEALGWPRLALVEPFRFIPPGEYPWKCWVEHNGEHSIAYGLECARRALDRMQRESTPTSNPTPETA